MKLLEDRILKDGNVLGAVSYTHLDVYKRQLLVKATRRPEH